MNKEKKEVSLKSDLKIFNIDIDDIELNPHFFETLQEAIDKMREETLAKNLEVVLNNNLIEARYKPTNYRTILGCRVSYADLEKSISFIVRPDEKPSYEYLEQEYIEYMRAKRKPINSCVELSKYFIGRHTTLPVYLTPTFEREFNYIVIRLKNKEELIDKLSKAIFEIKDSIETTGGYPSNYIDELLQILEDKEVTE